MMVPPKHPKMIIFCRNPMVVGYHYFRKPPYRYLRIEEISWPCNSSCWWYRWDSQVPSNLRYTGDQWVPFSLGIFLTEVSPGSLRHFRWKDDLDWILKNGTLPKFNMEPENTLLEKENHLNQTIIFRFDVKLWWFQPIWKICSSNWIISSNRGENRKCFKPPPSKSSFRKMTFTPDPKICSWFP